MTAVRLLVLTPVAAALLLAAVYLLTPVSRVEVPEPSGGYLDVHAQIAGTGAGGSGIFISDELANSRTFEAYLDGLGMTRRELEQRGDELVAKRLNDVLARSLHVRNAVIAGLDGVVRDGRLDRSATRIYVPNEFVAEMADKYDHLEHGASVHPDRTDWEQRLIQAKEQGALLVKWLPDIMQIDPSESRHIPYYQALARLDLPLLVHLGKGRAFGESSGALSDPRKLALALDQGVTVIAAHAATTGRYGDQASGDRLLSMLPDYPNLYADISRLTRLGKVGNLVELLTAPGVPERLIYGSDWPMLSFPTVHSLYHWPDIDVSTAKSIHKLNNVLDRDVALKSALGVPPAVFRRSAELLLD